MAPRVAAALGLGLGLAAVGAHLAPRTPEDATDPAAGWLHVPLLIGAIVAVTATIELHPGFGRDRPGADWLHRLHVGALDGCAVATASSAVATAVLAAVTGALFELVAHPGPSRPLETSVALVPVGPERLDPAAPRAELVARWTIPATGLELRPIVGFTGGSLPDPRVRIVAADVDELRAMPPGGGLVRVPLAGAPLDRVVLELAPGERAAVLLPEGSVRAVAPARVAPWLDAATAAAATGWAVAIALAFATLARRHVGAPVLHLTAIALVVVATGAGLAPTLAGVAAHARGRVAWNPEVAAASLRAATTVILTVAVARVSSSLRRR